MTTTFDEWINSKYPNCDSHTRELMREAWEYRAAHTVYFPNCCDMHGQYLNLDEPCRNASDQT